MNEVLGYDCDDNEIYEYRILRAIWANDIDIEMLYDEDPRHYCAVVAEDGKAYAISVYDWWHQDLIRQREGIGKNHKIPTVVKPFEDMINYEVATCNNGEDAFFYTLNKEDLKNKLNELLQNKKLVRKLNKRKG